MIVRNVQINFINIHFFFITNSSYAYLGPGVGAGIIAATLGVLVAIFAALFGLIWFPLKKLLKRRKEKQNNKKKEID